PIAHDPCARRQSQELDAASGAGSDEILRQVAVAVFEQSQLGGRAIDPQRACNVRYSPAACRRECEADQLTGFAMTFLRLEAVRAHEWIAYQHVGVGCPIHPPPG